MKKKYVEPCVTLINFSREDILTLSSMGDNDGAFDSRWDFWFQ